MRILDLVRVFQHQPNPCTTQSVVLIMVIVKRGASSRWSFGPTPLYLLKLGK